MLLPTPPRVALAQLPTPFHPLDRVSQSLGGPRIWIKRDDLTGTALTGNKVRKLEFVVAQALADGCNALITCGGVQSNHCRATALVGAQHGLAVHLLLRDDRPSPVPDGNLLLADIAGAQIRVIPPAEYRKRQQELLIEIADDCRNRGLKPFIIPTGASDEIGVWGYLSACEELKNDCAKAGIQPQKIIVATGSGGTQAGLTLGNALLGLNSEVLGIAVCDDEAYFKRKVLADLNAWQQRYGVNIPVDSLNIQVNADYIGPAYGVATDEVFETIRWLARREGIVLDPVYTGKAFHGLVQEIKNGHLSNKGDLVFVHTGGIYGLFPQKEQLKKNN